MSILLKRHDLQEALDAVKSWNAGEASYLIEGVLTGEIIFSVGLQFWVDKWPGFNFILLTTGEDYKYDFFANVSSFAIKNPNNIRSMLMQAIPLKRKDLILGNYPLKHKRIYDELMTAWKSTIVFSFQTKLLAVNSNDLKSYDLPYAYTSCELAIKDAQILNAHWQFAGVGTLRYIIDHIENFPCLGVKDKDDRLVAWELSYFTGAMGMLYVMEEHRGKGLAKFIICKLARKLLQLGRNVYCFVEDTNEISLNLHKKCGFSIQEGHSGYFAKLLNDV